MKKKVKIGQILTSKVDTVVEKALSGDKITIPKGNKVIVCSDGTVMHKNGMIQNLGGDFEIDGYDNKCIADYILRKLITYLPFQDMCKDYDVEKSQVVETIKEALDGILI